MKMGVKIKFEEVWRWSVRIKNLNNNEDMDAKIEFKE